MTSDLHQYKKWPLTFLSMRNDLWPSSVWEMTSDLHQDEKWPLTFISMRNDLWPSSLKEMTSDLHQYEKWPLTFITKRNDLWPSSVWEMTFDLHHYKKWPLTFIRIINDPWPSWVSPFSPLLFPRSHPWWNLPAGGMTVPWGHHQENSPSPDTQKNTNVNKLCLDFYLKTVMQIWQK